MILGMRGIGGFGCLFDVCDRIVVQFLRIAAYLKLLYGIHAEFSNHGFVLKDVWLE